MPNVYPAHTETRPKRIVVHCGDPRFQDAFRQFILKELGLKEGEFIPVVVTGGGAHLSEPLKLPKDFRSLMDQVAFYAEHFGSIEEVDIINHEDCGKYAALATKLGALFHIGRGTSSVADRIQADLPYVVPLIKDKLPRNLKIGLYYAHFDSPERKGIVIDKIALSA